MNRTFRELVYEKQNATPQEKDAYETMLEQVRDFITQLHADTLAQILLASIGFLLGMVAACIALRRQRLTCRPARP